MAEYVFNLWESEAPYVEGGEADYDVVMAAHEAFSKAVVEAGGTVVQGWALRGIKSATFLRGTRTEAVHTVDNPLPEVVEQLGGFYVIDVPTEEMALALARLAPAPYGYVEVRPVWDMDPSSFA
jgi:hypothetical protein